MAGKRVKALKEFTLDISGLGIIFYSPVHTLNIKDDVDYLSLDYLTEQQVQTHIQKGSIVCFCTGTPGTYSIKIHSGYPTAEYLRNCNFKLRLGLHCLGALPAVILHLAEGSIFQDIVFAQHYVFLYDSAPMTLLLLS